MGLSGRILSVLLVFVMLAGVLLASWLFWGKALETTEQVSTRLLEDTIKLAVQDARTQLNRIVTDDGELRSLCEQNAHVDFCVDWNVDSDKPPISNINPENSTENTGILYFRQGAMVPAVSAEERNVFQQTIREQLSRQVGSGAGVVYWQQHPLWFEFDVREGQFRGAGIVLTGLLDRWSGNIHMGMSWRWRKPDEKEVPWGMAEVRLPTISGTPISLLVNSSMLAPAVVASWSGISVVAAAGALSLMAWLFFYRPVWQRLDRLLFQLRGILSQRDYSGRIDLRGKDEISELAQHCNGLLSALEYSHHLMAKTNLVTTELLSKLDKSSVGGVAADWQGADDPWRYSMDMATRFSNAIANQQLVMHYQPVVTMDTGLLVSWEALCRWQCPERGLLLPGEFMQIAEQSGQMQAMLRWSIQRVCKDSSRLPETRPRISINISHLQLMDQQLVNVVESILHEQGLEPDVLEFEIKEASLLKDFDKVTKQIESLRAIGVGVCVDGYGFGAHSLTYLQRLPVTRLKLSRVFSERISLEHREIAFIEGIARFAAGLGVTVVATNIETDQQLVALRGSRGIAAQGFAIARPMTVEDANQWRAAASLS